MATGLNSSVEAANNSMKELFEDKYNIQIFCSQFSSIIINTYRLPVKMIVAIMDYLWRTHKEKYYF